MYLNKILVLTSFRKLAQLTDGNGKSATEVTSAIRYLLATSALIRNKSQGNSIDLSTGNETNRLAFIKEVGNIVHVAGAKYTNNFNGEFLEHPDYAVRNNFLTTRLKTTGKNGYPGRPAPLLEIENETVSILNNVASTLRDKYHNFAKVKSSLAIWILRNTIFESGHKTLDELVQSINNKLAAKFEKLVYNTLKIDSAEFQELIDESNLEIVNVLQNDKSDFMDFLETSVEHAENKRLLERDFNIRILENTLPESGLIFNNNLVWRFASSLLTKRFLILTGLSGSGKTKLAHSFAKWICENEKQYKLVPVGADWTSREPLLGFPSALNSAQYVQPESGVLQIILDANADDKKPYFIILDEMNLSHVERYFADFLSAMESKGKIYLHSDEDGISGIPPSVSLPKNLFIIGTVNIDETTYMFSPKVLDRAGVIEFRVTAEEMESFLKKPSATGEIELGAGSAMAESFVKLAGREFSPNIDTDDYLTKELKELFVELKSVGAEFGYRSAGEIRRWAGVVNHLNPDWTKETILDAAIMQKLLPKLHGSRKKLLNTLITLAGRCLNEKDDKKIKNLLDAKYDSAQVVSAPLPLSYEKLHRMYSNLMSNGFTSYAEA